jgi:3-isopropylmalate/(R)-2-methylmalate dehydratase large subunit
MGKTIAEKVLSDHAGIDAKAGDIVLSDIDLLMGHDWNATLTVQVFREMGGDKVFDPGKVVFVIDHGVPTINEKIAVLQKDTEDFALNQGTVLYGSGAGICHQLLPEQGHVLPGMVVIGSDSHTTTYGALNAFSAGVGSTDLAAALFSGKLWFRVPESMKIILKGTLPEGVYAKDLILSIIGKLTAEGASYMSVEFTGDGVRSLSIDARLTVSNMGIEMGAKATIFEADSELRKWLAERTSKSFETVSADPDAEYAQVHEWDLSSLEPQVARPHRVDDVLPIREIEGLEVGEGFLGACTNGRLEDLQVAAGILKGKKVHPNFRLFVGPASREVLITGVQTGVIEEIVKAGGILLPPGCGPCHGVGGVPRDSENVISTANRNFKGRMGNNKAFIYLASPATVAASALQGAISDPRKYME